MELNYRFVIYIECKTNMDYKLYMKIFIHLLFPKMTEGLRIIGNITSVLN